ncbi:Hpt domain-containing protein [Sphingorhabdus arenilitoris]|uniref:Hpt domain-containing protein n=1 Tax=Sphingorhabdus arenilitoris TaxID=1490041 RepID=A0ABV8RDT6_9SPHN
MSTPMADDLINWKAFAETRNLMGAGFVRILGYFREDGMKSLATIEEAMRLKDSAKLVMPAHTLKGESWQFGAEKLGSLAEQVEITARHYVEIRQDPSDLVEKVAALRPTFEATLAALEAEVSPLVERKPHAFGNRSAFGGRGFSS